MLLQRLHPNRRLYTVLAAAAIVVGILVGSIWALARTGDEPAPAASRSPSASDGMGQSGGGGETPPLHLLEANAALPLFPGAIADEEPRRGYTDLFAAYWAPGQPAEVMDFYVNQLPAQGWKLLGPPEKITGGTKLDGTTQTRISTRFSKGELQLQVDVFPNTKYPPAGATMLFIYLDSRPLPARR